MAAYISSQNNRFYVAPETSYGQAASFTAAHRISAVKLTVRHNQERSTRRDKTGGRTFVGLPNNLRTQTQFELRSYLSAWDKSSSAPAHGPLFAALTGTSGTSWSGLAATGAASANGISFATAHGLKPGQAVSFGGEIRFVTAVANDRAVQVNAPFTTALTGSSTFDSTVTYQPGDELSSVSIMDCWDPGTSVQRLLPGAAVDKLSMDINGDFHEFAFSGSAQTLLDSVSFASGAAQLTEFPAEPTLGAFDTTIVPGHLGQVWLGSEQSRVYTVTGGRLEYANGINMRAQEFGANALSVISAGTRTVTLNLQLYADDSTALLDLYRSSRDRTPVSAMLQLGQEGGQLFGVYLKSVVLETPEFIDSESRLQWGFVNCRATGTLNDEIFFAFA